MIFPSIRSDLPIQAVVRRSSRAVSFANSVDLDDARRSGAGHRERRLGPRRGGRRLVSRRQTREGVPVPLAREVVVGWGGWTAMQPDPDAEKGIAVAVALLPRGDEVDVLEPRQIILRRPGRPLEPVRNLGERQIL